MDIVAGLTHQLGEAGAQAVPGEAVGVEAGVQGSLLDQAHDRLVGQSCFRDPASFGAREPESSTHSGLSGGADCPYSRHPPVHV